MLFEGPTRSYGKRVTLADYFAQFTESPALYLQYDNGYRGWSYTYAQVGAAARTFSAKLHAQGIGKGDKVLFWSENRPEWVAAFWGCAIRGVIVVPIDYRASADFLLRVQEQVSARAILIGDEVRLPVWATQPPVWRLSELDWTSTGVAGRGVPLQPNDIAEIVFTSGATGEPKGVLISHRNILSNLATPERIISKYVKWFRPVFPLRFLNLVPLSHMFGQAVTMLLVPLIPAEALFMRGYSPHEIVRQIRSRRISLAAVVPKLLEVLREHVLQQFPEAARPLPAGIHWTRRWWHHRRIHRYFGLKFWAFISGAAPLEPELEEFWSSLGFLVVQGYGLTETAPIVAFNNPFAIRKGTVGQPVEGTEIKIAADGEILVRGDSVTPGYYGAPAESSSAFSEGWLHTGDIGSIDDTGRLTIRGRKKEVIVTPEGLKVFPEDVERVLNAIPGVRESAVIGRGHPHAVLVLEGGTSPEEVIRTANQRLEDHQRVRGLSVWSGNRLPRTTGTEKIKRSEIQRWVDAGATAQPSPSGDRLLDVVKRYAPGREVTESTTLDQLGLTSLDRVELLMDLEQHLDTSVDESALAGSRTLGELTRVTAAPTPAEVPRWSRSWPARIVRNAALFTLWLPLTRLFTRARVKGREHLAALSGPVIFTANHQSNMDTPCILAALPARYRYRAGVAMWKEFFDAHFHPERHTKLQWLGNSFLYWLLALLFNAFPLPQTETGASGSLRYLGDLVSGGWSVLFFPEGERTETGEIHPFQPGIGLIASRLRVPIVPVRLRGVEAILHRGRYFPRPGRVEVTFGRPLHLSGEDYLALAKQVEQAVREL
ncbi:MAG: AMP-binding protein [Acidobacteriia bacterium]|nr:AMP-binding protein [Terriglobia bacterium]